MNSSAIRYAVITGAASGMGRCYALQLAQMGYGVLLVDINGDAAQLLSQQIISEYDVPAPVVSIDLTLPDAAEQIFSNKEKYSLADRQAVGFLMTAFSLEDIQKMVEDLYNVLMGIPDPFEFLEKIVKEPPYELWNQQIMTSIDLDVLGLEECLRQEQDLLQDPLALASCYDTAQADSDLIASFLEAYDFSGKKIVLFATSGGSAFGKVTDDLKVSVPESTQIIEGALLNGNPSVEALKKFVSEF